ncbi:MAG: hypothetical protein WBF76_21345, partial [Pseudonocardiaceae bacterium]
MSTAAGPDGGTARGGGASAAPPPILPPPEPAPADPREPSQRPVDAGHCARLHALSTPMPSPDR